MAMKTGTHTKSRLERSGGQKTDRGSIFRLSFSRDQLVTPVCIEDPYISVYSYKDQVDMSQREYKR